MLVGGVADGDSGVDSELGADGVVDVDGEVDGDVDSEVDVGLVDAGAVETLGVVGGVGRRLEVVAGRRDGGVDAAVDVAG